MGLDARQARRITIHCPIASQTFAALAAGDLAAIERDPCAAEILALIRSDNPLGDFGVYRGVFEVALGLEGFKATEDARPALGRAGADMLSPTAIITTYVASDAAADEVDAMIAALARAHPWEVPVIELSDVLLARKA